MDKYIDIKSQNVYFYILYYLCNPFLIIKNRYPISHPNVTNKVDLKIKLIIHI